MLPERSSIASSAKSVFFEDVNDIDIYIEDTGCGYEKLFNIVFSRVFEGKYRVEKVFPLGGRMEVVERFLSESEELIRPSLFVVDGDLYLLCGDNAVQSQKGFYKLPFYCVENILIDEAAILGLLDEEEPVKTMGDLSEEFQYSTWVRENIKALHPLFIEYAITFKINPEVQTVSYKVRNLVSDDSGFVDSQKIKRRVMYLREKNVGRYGERYYKEVKQDILQRFESTKLDLIDVVSAKDYLIPLMRIRFNRVVRNRISDINFKQRLARRCDVSGIMECDEFVYNGP